MFNKNITLIGFMGCGKSTVSKALSAKLGIDVVDTDEYIVEKNKCSIADMFDKHGEEFFRDKETEAVREISKREGIIISCGGGAVLRDENVTFLKENGAIVLLNATPETIFERVRDSKDRPILNGNMNVEYITELMNRRAGRYENVADVEVHTDNRSVDDIVCEIIEKIVEKYSIVL